MNPFEKSNLVHLADQVQQLLNLMRRLRDENRELKRQLGDPSLPGESQEKIRSLTDEIRRIKKENKTLKEREKLIKNKIERLAVKLDDIDW